MLQATPIPLKKRRANPQLALQITSMVDIFILILVFLIKVYSSSASNITPVAGSLLPKARHPGPPPERLRIEIFEAGVTVDGKATVALQHFRFAPDTLNAAGVAPSMQRELKRQRERQALIAQNNPEVKSDAAVLIVADQRVPYETLKSVLASAAVEGYTDYKLIVARSD
jgi:biopolymer transport protein ExbD